MKDYKKLFDDFFNSSEDNTDTVGELKKEKKEFDIFIKCYPTDMRDFLNHLEHFMLKRNLMFGVIRGLFAKDYNNEEGLKEVLEFCLQPYEEEQDDPFLTSFKNTFQDWEHE